MSKTFGEILREKRKEKGWTLVELAEKANTHFTTISCYERHRREPTLFIALDIANALGCSVYELCGMAHQEVECNRFKKINVLKDAISTYGTSAQVDMAIEEMSELTKALCKERRAQHQSEKHAEAQANVIEEIADVAIMLEQLLIIFDKDHEVQKVVDYKIDRLEQRLGV